MSSGSLGSAFSDVFSDDEFAELDIVPALLSQRGGSPRESLAVIQKRLKRTSVLTQTKRSTRIEEQQFFQELLDDEDVDIADEIARSVSSSNCVPDSQIDSLCFSEEHSRNSNSLGLVRTKSGRGASLLVEAQDEHEKVGLIQYEDGIEEMRRRQSFHTLESDTFDERVLLFDSDFSE